MNRKGFTLVELLAVIAIMAIIIIIAIPNVMEGLNQGKMENFGNEASSIFGTAKTQYNLEKGQGKVKYVIDNNKRYAYYCQNYDLTLEPNCENAPALNISNSANTAYMFKLDVDGVVIQAEIISDDQRFGYSCYSQADCERFDKRRVYDNTIPKVK